MIFYLKKYALEVPAYNGRLRSKFEVNRTSHFSLVFSYYNHSSFCTNHKNRSNSEKHALIGLKFDMHVDQPNANISTKFGAYICIWLLYRQYSCTQVIL